MKWKSKFKYIIILIIFCILLGLTPFYLNDERELSWFEKATKDVIVFAQKLLSAPIVYVKDEIEIIKEKDNLYKKYAALKDKEEKIELYNSEIKELQKEIQELKSVLDLNSTLSEYSYVNATIVNRSIENWYNSLTIDKGYTSGINKGDAVITNRGLIGKIASVSNYSSTVRLLTSEEINNKISIKVECGDGYQYGLLVDYDKSNNVYKIEGITDYECIKQGNTVTTTGLTEYFPSGIIVGSVYRIVSDEYDLSSMVEVKPISNFEDISIVTVLRRKAT